MTHRIARRRTSVVEGPVAATGPVLAGLLGPRCAEAVLRFAFTEAQRRTVPLRVVIAGIAAGGTDAFLADLIERWADKCPDVPVATSLRHGVDAAVVLAAATSGCGLVVLPELADATTLAVRHALARRAHCPLVLVGETADGQPTWPGTDCPA